MRQGLAPPPALTTAGVSLRAVTGADRPFLEGLYRSVRWDEFAPTGWPDDAKIAFLASQFDFQQRHYANAFAEADYLIVECGGGPIGRLSVDRTPPDLHLVEISLLAQWRGKGVGGALVAMLQDEVRAGRAERVTLNVDRANPGALRLYARLGFAEQTPTSPYPGASIDMVWPPPGAVS